MHPSVKALPGQSKKQPQRTDPMYSRYSRQFAVHGNTILNVDTSIYTTLVLEIDLKNEQVIQHF